MYISIDAYIFKECTEIKNGKYMAGKWWLVKMRFKRFENANYISATQIQNNSSSLEYKFNGETSAALQNG